MSKTDATRSADNGDWFGVCNRTELCFWWTGPNDKSRIIEAVDHHNRERQAVIDTHQKKPVKTLEAFA